MLFVILYVLRRFVMTVTVLLAAVLTATAQQDASFSHYWAMETSFNPAAAGKQSVINVTGAYAMSMVGFEHNPKTMYVSGDMPLMLMNTYHGVGLMLMSDDIVWQRSMLSRCACLAAPCALASRAAC